MENYCHENIIFLEYVYSGGKYIPGDLHSSDLMLGSAPYSGSYYEHFRLARHSRARYTVGHIVLEM
jgi:hypothetical protein